MDRAEKQERMRNQMNEAETPEERNSPHKYCKGCGRALALSYKKEHCAACEELQLFDSVREYVRTYEVNEYDVADHFEIPVRRIRDWIKEGRIEYKEQGTNALGGSVCFRCGAKVSFGTLCTKCLKLMNGEGKQGMMTLQPGEAGRMRFVDPEEEK